jgi:hypothetical protein
MMNNEQFNCEARYETAMAAARSMLKNGILNDKDYCKIDTMMRRKYRPVIGGLLPVKNPNKP